MNKLWLPIFLLAAIVAGGIGYNFYLGNKTDSMLQLAEEAYEMTFEDMKKTEACIEEIDAKLDKITVLLCAFIDRDIISEVEESIVSAKELTMIDPARCRWGISLMKEKISHIKNSTQIKLKYIL